MNLTVLLVVIFTIFSACSAQKVESQATDSQKEAIKSESRSKNYVLVELFTSEGCSSCPPADRNLAFIEREQPFMQAEVVTLAFHVDYWDHIGWKDPYSSPLFTQRQEIYARKLKLDSTYTPQMIVDGKTQFVGSDAGKAANSVILAAKEPKANVAVVAEGEKLKIEITEMPKHENATVYLAVAENNLASNVKSGENSGRKLEHTSVVRELKAVGSISADQSVFEIETAVNLPREWKKQDLKFIVFVQENESRRIIGVNRIAAL